MDNAACSSDYSGFCVCGDDFYRSVTLQQFISEVKENCVCVCVCMCVCVCVHGHIMYIHVCVFVREGERGRERVMREGGGHCVDNTICFFRLCWILCV